MKKHKQFIHDYEVISSLLIGEFVILIIHQQNHPMHKKRISGFILNESRNTITLKTHNKIRNYPKNQISIEKNFQNKMLRISGSLLKGRPAERIKFELKKKW